MYKLSYLQFAKKDLEAITDYIVDTLKAPKAAFDFIDSVEDGINRLCELPFSCRVYKPIKPVDLEYRVLTIKNYLIFYIVLDDTVEIHRIVYGRRNLSQLIK